LYNEARTRRRHWLIGDERKRLNGAAIARDLGVPQPTISRLITGTRNLSRSPNRKRPIRPYQIDGRLEEALMSFFRFSSLEGLWSAIENSPSIGPMRVIKRRGPARTKPDSNRSLHKRP
jgi:hypothetical protein